MAFCNYSVKSAVKEQSPASRKKFQAQIIPVRAGVICGSVTR